MRVLTGILAAISACVIANSALAWEVKEIDDPMTDKKTWAFFVVGEESFFGKIALMVYCDGSKWVPTVATGANYSVDKVGIMYRFDDEPAKTEEWDVLDKYMLSPTSEYSFMKQLIGKDKILVRFALPQGAVKTVSMNVSNFRQIASPATKYCPLP